MTDQKVNDKKNANEFVNNDDDLKPVSRHDMSDLSFDSNFLSNDTSIPSNEAKSSLDNDCFEKPALMSCDSRNEEDTITHHNNDIFKNLASIHHHHYHHHHHHRRHHHHNHRSSSSHSLAYGGGGDDSIKKLEKLSLLSAQSVADKRSYQQLKPQQQHNQQQQLNQQQHRNLPSEQCIATNKPVSFHQSPDLNINDLLNLNFNQSVNNNFNDKDKSLLGNNVKNDAKTDEEDEDDVLMRMFHNDDDNEHDDGVDDEDAGGDDVNYDVPNYLISDLQGLTNVCDNRDNKKDEGMVVGATGNNDEDRGLYSSKLLDKYSHFRLNYYYSHYQQHHHDNQLYMHHHHHYHENAHPFYYKQSEYDKHHHFNYDDVQYLENLEFVDVFDRVNNWLSSINYDNQQDAASPSNQTGFLYSNSYHGNSYLDSEHLSARVQNRNSLNNS